MGKGHREDWLEFWERLELPFLSAIPYVLLVVALAIDMASRSGFTGQALIDLALAAGALATMLAMGNGVGRRDPCPTAVSAVAFLALVGIMAAMVIRAPLFGFFAWTGYIWAFRALRGRARLVGVALVAGTVAISQTGAGPYRSVGQILTLLLVYAINCTIASTFTWFGWIGHEQTERRRRAIDELTEANVRLEESLRENAALQVQLVSQARASGMLEERQRMSREIHDTLAQGLAGIITQLQAALHAGAADGPGGRHLEAAVGLARESLTEARRSVRALAPEPLEGARLPDAVREVAGRWSRLHGVPATVTVTGQAREMRPEIEVALLRTTQEALANVAKHARAGRVGLTLSYMEDVVTLDVRDDGAGFEVLALAAPAPTAGARDGGFGLSAMRQRVEGVAGTLHIESAPRAGTAISATVPAIAASAE